MLILYQWQYTASQYNYKSFEDDDVQPGFHVYSLSKELKDDQELLDVLELTLAHYVPPTGSPQNPTPEQCRDSVCFPPACTYFQLPNGYSVLSQTVAVGDVYGVKVKDMLNFFTHAYIFESDDFKYIDPFSYFENKFKRGLTEEEAQSDPNYLEGDYLDQSTETDAIANRRKEIRDNIFRVQKATSQLSVQGTRSHRLLKAIFAAFKINDRRPHVIVVTGEENPLELLKRTFALLPLGVAKRVEFITYTGDLFQEIRPCIGDNEDKNNVFKRLATHTDINQFYRDVLVVFVPSYVFVKERESYRKAKRSNDKQPWLLFLDYNTPDDGDTDSSYYWNNDAVAQCLDEFLETFDQVYPTDCPRNEILVRFNEHTDRWQKFIKIDKPSEDDFHQNKELFAVQGFETFKRIYQSFVITKDSDLNVDTNELPNTGNNERPDTDDNELLISPNIQAWLDCLPQDRLANLVLQALAYVCDLNDEQRNKLNPKIYDDKGSFTQIIVSICRRSCEKLIELLYGECSTSIRHGINDKAISHLTHIFFRKIYEKEKRQRTTKDPNKVFPKFIDYLPPELVCVYFWRVMKLYISQNNSDVLLDKSEQDFILREFLHAWNKIESPSSHLPEGFIPQLCDTLHDFWGKELYKLTQRHSYSKILSWWHTHFEKYHEKGNFFGDVFEQQICDKLYYPNPNDKNSGVYLAYNSGLTMYVQYLSGKSLDEAQRDVEEELKTARKSFIAKPTDMNFRNAKKILTNQESIDALTQYCRLKALQEFIKEALEKRMQELIKPASQES